MGVALAQAQGWRARAPGRGCSPAATRASSWLIKSSSALQTYSQDAGAGSWLGRRLSRTAPRGRGVRLWAILEPIKRGLGRRRRFPRRAQQLTGVELRESTTVAGRPLSMPMGWATSLAEEIDREAALSGRVRH